MHLLRGEDQLLKGVVPHIASLAGAVLLAVEPCVGVGDGPLHDEAFRQA